MLKKITILLVSILTIQLALANVNIEGTYTNFSNFPESFFSTDLTPEQVVEVTDQMFLSSNEFLNNNIHYDKIEYIYDTTQQAAYTNENKIYVGDGFSPSNQQYHAWQMYSHEMSHAFTISQYRFNELSNMVLDEMLAVLNVFYFNNKLESSSNHLGLTEQYQSLRLKLDEEINNQATKYQEYLTAGKPYTQEGISGNALLTSQALGYKIYLLAEQYGWNNIPKFVDAFSSDIKNEFTFWQDGVTDLERSTYIIAALSASFDQDLKQEFLDLNFEINNTLHDEIKEKIINFNQETPPPLIPGTSGISYEIITNCQDNFQNCNKIVGPIYSYLPQGDLDSPMTLTLPPNHEYDENISDCFDPYDVAIGIYNGYDWDILPSSEFNEELHRYTASIDRLFFYAIVKTPACVVRECEFGSYGLDPSANLTIPEELTFLICNFFEGCDTVPNECNPRCPDGVDPDCGTCSSSQGDCCSISLDGICDLDCAENVDPDCRISNMFGIELFTAGGVHWRSVVSRERICERERDLNWTPIGNWRIIGPSNYRYYDPLSIICESSQDLTNKCAPDIFLDGVCDQNCPFIGNWNLDPDCCERITSYPGDCCRPAYDGVCDTDCIVGVDPDCITSGSRAPYCGDGYCDALEAPYYTTNTVTTTIDWRCTSTAISYTYYPRETDCPQDCPISQYRSYIGNEQITCESDESLEGPETGGDFTEGWDSDTGPVDLSQGTDIAGQ